MEINYELDNPEDIEEKEEMVRKELEEAENAPVREMKPVADLIKKYAKK